MQQKITVFEWKQFDCNLQIIIAILSSSEIHTIGRRFESKSTDGERERAIRSTYHK